MSIATRRGEPRFDPEGFYRFPCPHCRNDAVLHLVGGEPGPHDIDYRDLGWVQRTGELRPDANLWCGACGESWHQMRLNTPTEFVLRGYQGSVVRFAPVPCLSITPEPRVDIELVAPGMLVRALGRRLERETADRLQEMLTLVAIEERPELTLPPLEDSNAGFSLEPISVEEDDVILRLQVTACLDQPLGTATTLTLRMGRDAISAAAREAE